MIAVVTSLPELVTGASSVTAATAMAMSAIVIVAPALSMLALCLANAGIAVGH